VRLRSGLVGFAAAAALVVPALAAPNARKGRELFLGKGCNGCHKVDGVGGVNGPDLSRVGKRLRPEQIARKIINPRADMPNSIMASAKQLNMTNQDVIDVAGYLSTLK
jgi:cbb3-type cytochrome oxidase cytochrome c subunit